MKRIIFSFLFLCMGAMLVAQTGYTNPIIPGFYPDPSVCRVGNDYYLVTSTFEYSPGVPVFHSKDMVNWQQIGHCLTRESQSSLAKQRYSGGIYAPTIRHHEGKFYMVTTNTGGGGNFYVTATDPAGEWSEPTWVNQPGIDPTIFWDEDGKVYFMSTGGWEEGIIMSQIDIKTGKRLTEPKSIWGGTGGRYPEAPHIYKKDGYYYLLIAEGGTEYAHKVTIARSQHIWGPYEGCPHNPILTHCSEAAQTNPIQGTGHADLVEAHDGSWWMVFLAFRPQVDSHHLLGRETFLAPVSWSADGWPVVNNNQPVLTEMNCPTLPLQPWPQTGKGDNFDKDKLGFEWIYLRNPVAKNYALKDGHLQITGSDVTLNENNTPSFVGRRQQHIKFEASTQVEAALSKDNDEVGLTVYMNPFSHYDLFTTKKDGKKYLCLRYQLGKITHIAKEIEIEDGNLQLKVTGTRELYRFAYSLEGQGFIDAGSADTRYLSTETAGGFTGIILGLYAVSTNPSAPTIGKFDWFEYAEN